MRHVALAACLTAAMEAPPRFEVTAPEGAPNVVIVLIDDIMVTGGSTLHAVGKKVEGA